MAIHLALFTCKDSIAIFKLPDLNPFVCKGDEVALRLNIHLAFWLQRTLHQLAIIFFEILPLMGWMPSLSIIPYIAPSRVSLGWTVICRSLMMLTSTSLQRGIRCLLTMISSIRLRAWWIQSICMGQVILMSSGGQVWKMEPREAF